MPRVRPSGPDRVESIESVGDGMGVGVGVGPGVGVGVGVGVCDGVVTTEDVRLPAGSKDVVTLFWSFVPPAMFTVINRPNSS